MQPTHECKNALSNKTIPPLFVAINESSGADAANVLDQLNELLRAAGHNVSIFKIPEGSDPAEMCLPLVMKASITNSLVVAAGGDGTVNAIAKLCYNHKVSFSVIPLGTFNYFARAVGIPAKMEDAVTALSHGVMHEVSAGFVEQHMFLNNASFGLYPKLIRKREAATARFGRRRIVGAITALKSLFEKQRCFSITCTIDGKIEKHLTTMIFIGNNSLQLDTLGLDVSACTQKGCLAVVILKPCTRLQMARLLWRGVVRNLHFEDRLLQFCADEFELATTQKKIEIVVDGELVKCTSPLTFRVEPRALKVLAPKSEIK